MRERIPVSMDQATKEFLYSSGQEAAKFPQALGEAFMLAEANVTVSLALKIKHEIFPGVDPAEMVIETSVIPTEQTVMQPCVMYTNGGDFSQARMGTQYGFSAVKTANEFVRIYRTYEKSNSLA